jgi:hypothetical protein
MGYGDMKFGFGVSLDFFRALSIAKSNKLREDRFSKTCRFPSRPLRSSHRGLR